MRTPQSAVAGIAAGQHGLFTLGQALDAGLTTGVLERWLVTGTIVRAHQGVYRYAAAAETWQGCLHAAVLAGGATTVASHRSAARLWRLREVPRWRPEVTNAGTRLPLLLAVDRHRTDTLGDRDVTSVEGIPCTTVPRTLLDLGAVVDRRVVRTAAQDAIIRRLTSVLDLVCILERLGGRGRRGTAALRWTVRSCLPPSGLESALESALLGVVRSSGVPEPVVQHELRCNDGRVVRLDFAWPERRIGLEADGRRWHATSTDFERDMARANSISMTGWRLLRFGWSEVHHDPARVAALLRQLFRLPAAA